MKSDRQKFKGLEIAMDNIRIEEQLLPPGESLAGLPDRNSDYFRKYGFKVSGVFSSLYEKAGCVPSEKYIPASLYFYYISPYLLNMNLTMAYVDKNAYWRLFPDVRQPETILHNINGRFHAPGYILGYDSCSYTGPRKESLSMIDKDEALSVLEKEPEYIIKPSIESGRGRDVMLCREIGDRKRIEEILDSFGSDYIIQRVVRQHPDLAKLNPTSLNTCRVYTYLPIGEKELIVLGVAVRFGGEGAYRDNACTGGGFCKIHEDGGIDDRICQYRFWGRRSLKDEKGLEEIQFPAYGKVIETCLDMHRRLPYMDLVGWDIAVDESGTPVLIELNQYPDCEFIQLFNGPMFGKYTDSLLEAISRNDTSFLTVAKRSFRDLTSHHDYLFEIGKQYSI